MESEPNDRQLRDRIAHLEQSRRELGDQMEHLIDLLEASRREIAWLKGQVRERDERAGNAPQEP